MFSILLFAIYFLFVCILLILIALNAKKIRRKYRVDTVLPYMFIYLMNAIIIYAVLRAGTWTLGITTFVMVFIIYRVSKTQVIGLTGIFCLIFLT